MAAAGGGIVSLALALGWGVSRLLRGAPPPTPKEEPATPKEQPQPYRRPVEKPPPEEKKEEPKSEEMKKDNDKN